LNGSDGFMAACFRCLGKGWGMSPKIGNAAGLGTARVTYADGSRSDIKSITDGPVLLLSGAHGHVMVHIVKLNSQTGG
jgi:hypothetical protein